MDLTPIVPAGRQVIERYGPTGFRVTGVIWRGPLLVFPDLTLPWTAVDAGRGQLGEPDAGRRAWRHADPAARARQQYGGVAGELRATLREAGIALEPMDTGAACRTYNVLVSEDRRVAAALIPPR